MKSLKLISLIPILGIFFYLAACSPATPTVTPTISLPSPTATTSLPLLMLLAPSESDPALNTTVAEIASSYAGTHGMQFEKRSLLNPAEVPPSLSKLVLLAPDPGASALAAAAPQAQVIAVGFNPDSVAENLIALPWTGNNASQVAFIAGYIAAISAEDWRVGFLYTAASGSLVNDFQSGAEYFCGSCIPLSPPLTDYPISIQADVQNWQSAADTLLAQSVKVVYLAPEMENSGVGQYLASSRALLVGNGAPPADLGESWIVSVTSSSANALGQLLPQALDGQPINPVSSVSLENANSILFSESRQTFAQQVIDDLLAGIIQLPSD